MVRAAGALALAPVVDRGLEFVRQRAGFTSTRQAFGAVVGVCVAAALLLFGSVVAAYA